MADLREWFQVTAPGQLVDPQVGHHIQGGAAVQGADGGGFALAGGGADDPVGFEQRRADQLAARVGRERHVAEHVRGPGAQQRVGDRLGLGQVVPADPQVQPPGVLVRHRFGPGRRVRAPQPRGEGLPALDDVRGGHPVRQVDVSAPPVAVAVHVGHEGEAGAVLDHRVDLGDAQRPQRPGDHLRGGRLVGGRHHGGAHDPLALRCAVPGQHPHRHDGGDQPAPPRQPPHHGQQHRHGGGGGLAAMIRPRVPRVFLPSRWAFIAS